MTRTSDASVRSNCTTSLSSLFLLPNTIRFRQRPASPVGLANGAGTQSDTAGLSK